MSQPEEEKNLVDDLTAQAEGNKRSRKEESKRLLQDIGKREDIEGRLESGINLTEWISRASGSGYRIGRDEWFEVIKEVIEEIRKEQGGKYESPKGVIPGSPYLSDNKKGFYRILEINKNLLGDENLKLIDDHDLG